MDISNESFMVSAFIRFILGERRPGKAGKPDFRPVGLASRPEFSPLSAVVDVVYVLYLEKIIGYMPYGVALDSTPTTSTTAGP